MFIRIFFVKGKTICLQPSAMDMLLRWEAVALLVELRDMLHINVCLTDITTTTLIFPCEISAVSPSFLQVSSSAGSWVWGQCFAMQKCWENMLASIKRTDELRGVRFWWIRQFWTSSTVTGSRLPSLSDADAFLALPCPHCLPRSVLFTARNHLSLLLLSHSVCGIAALGPWLIVHESLQIYRQVHRDAPFCEDGPYT